MVDSVWAVAPPRLLGLGMTATAALTAISGFAYAAHWLRPLQAPGAPQHDG